MIETLKTGTPELVKLNVKCHDLCILPDKTLLSVNFDNRNLTIYDEEFNLIKTIEKNQ